MKGRIPIKKGLAISILALFLSSTTAITINQQMDINGTANISTTYKNLEIVIKQIVYIDGVAYLNITYEDGSSELMRVDLYGSPGSDPRDIILRELEQINSSMSEICGHFGEDFYTMSTLPPKKFVNYVKNLGYDDETHITLIWTICQEQYMRGMGSYILEKQSQWSSDRTGITRRGLVHFFEHTVNWLMGNGGTTEEEKQVGLILDQYFANKKEIQKLQDQINYLNWKIDILEKRIRALEIAMGKVEEEAYTQAKMEVCMEVNCTAIGVNGKKYYNVRGKGLDYDFLQVKGVSKDTIPNHLPEITNIEIDTSQSVILKVTVVDQDNDKMQVTFYDASDDSVIDTVPNVESGSVVLAKRDVDQGSWYVIVSDDKGETKSEVFSFKKNLNELEESSFSAKLENEEKEATSFSSNKEESKTTNFSSEELKVNEKEILFTEPTLEYSNSEYSNGDYKLTKLKECLENNCKSIEIDGVKYYNVRHTRLAYDFITVEGH